MNCVMTRGMYLRANGRLPCYCSAGETVTLGCIDHRNLPSDMVADVFESPAFQHIRSAMAVGKAPFPGICEQCTYLETGQKSPPVNGDRVLEWFHFEPAYACNLECRWCEGQRRGTRGARWLPLETIRRIALDFARREYSMEKGNICGVGEPTLNADVWQMISLLKENLGGDILLSTNGNGPYSPQIVDCGLDQLKIAADAISQEAYARYRKNGSLARVLDFTSKIADRKSKTSSKTPLLIWQYIVFDYNDSDEDLLLYQKLARTHGVDRLRVVYTRCDHYSRRNPEDFPVDFKDVQFLPIKNDSLLSVEDAQKRLLGAEQLAREPGKASDAVFQAMGLAKHIFHRLTLGVERYVDLLAFTECIRPLVHGNCADLKAEEFDAFRVVLGNTFRLLAFIHRASGDAEQADGYLKFVERMGL